jgi:predicted acylesterase/phospholipase RssA
VLSGGGAKGDFEVGAVRYIYDQGWRPDVIAGTSVGAINGAKLAEGEDPAALDQGLPGLEAIWGSMRTNDDMYVRAAWLATIDPDIADFLTGTATAAVLTNAGDIGRTILGSWAGGAIDNALWLFGTGKAILEAAKTAQDQAVSLYDATPIRTKIDNLISPAKIAAWGEQGHKLRLAIVSLDSGALRYVNETGAVL